MARNTRTRIPHRIVNHSEFFLIGDVSGARTQSDTQVFTLKNGVQEIGRLGPSVENARR